MKVQDPRIPSENAIKAVKNVTMSPSGGKGGHPQYLFLAQIYQVPKTLGNGLCTLEILMPVNQLSYLSTYFQGKFNFHDPFWDGFSISATNGSNLAETENAQNALKWIFIST